MSASKARLETEVRELRAEMNRQTARYVSALAGDEDAKRVLFDAAGAVLERERCAKACEDSAVLALRMAKSETHPQRQYRAKVYAETCLALAKLMRRSPADLAKEVAA